MDYTTLTLTWYLMLLVIGVIFFPITYSLFSKFFDYGYNFSKIIGILLITYVSFVVSWTHLIPFSLGSILIILVLGVAINLYFFKNTSLGKNWKSIPYWHFIIYEIVFFTSLYVWVVVRGQEPAIRGLEKFMDFGFMQSILRSKYFPPADMWLAGNPINYYYFGHMTGAIMTKISGIPGIYSYNLILATLFALGITQTFSIGATLGKFIYSATKPKTWLKIILIGALASFLVNLGGNLHPIYLMTKGYENESPVPPWNVLKNKEDWTKLKTRLSEDSSLDLLSVVGQESKYWYPNATRFVRNTIHEFPIYSYVVADLHGHVYDIPYVLLTMAFLISLFLSKISKKEIEKLISKKHKSNQHNVASMTIENDESKFKFTDIFKLKRVITPVLLGFMIAIHYMTNAFDGPIYILMVTLSIFVLVMFGEKSWSTKVKWFAFIFYTMIIGVSFVVFNFPFSSGFKPFVSGIGVNCGWEIASKIFNTQESVIKQGKFLFEKNNCQITPTYQLLILWGFFWYNMFWFIIPQVIKFSKNTLESIKDEKIWVDAIMIIFFVIGTFLLIVPEYFYIKDIYPTHFRANTMFKLGYQAFIMMSIASAYTLFRLRDFALPKIVRFIYLALYLVMLFFIALYPNYAINSFYGTLNRKVDLDGSKWLKDQYPEYHEIIEYINTNIKGQPRILEAQGDSYTDFNLVSAYTGVPTVAGWWVHEWLWRGDSQVVGKITPDIVSIYEGKDPIRTKELLNKFGVKYFIIGPHEKTKYKNLSEETLSKVGNVLHRSKNGKATLYQIK